METKSIRPSGTHIHADIRRVISETYWAYFFTDWHITIIETIGPFATP